MVVLEKCAAGLGVGAVAWPQPFLCDAELPMTLGADVEMLKYCGKRLECAHGADISNGWAYSHAFGKLKAYQTALLGEAAFSSAAAVGLRQRRPSALVRTTSRPSAPRGP
ncbi:exodeoxyribonuclease III [Aureococcus anophagefferens]|nr:exodeoxyribonuclease III [Aureococcus anophagefferens]